MPFYKNVASQIIGVMAYDTANSVYKTGDAANITAYLRKDGGTPAATNDVNPTEVDATNMPGYYEFLMTQAESNADMLALIGKSATADILIEPVVIYTTPGSNAGVVSTAPTAAQNRAEMDANSTQLVRIGKRIATSSIVGMKNWNATPAPTATYTGTIAAGAKLEVWGSDYSGVNIEAPTFTGEVLLFDIDENGTVTVDAGWIASQNKDAIKLVSNGVVEAGVLTMTVTADGVNGYPITHVINVPGSSGEDMLVTPFGTVMGEPDSFTHIGTVDPRPAPTVGEIDAELTANHGAGAWTSGGGATPAEIDAELTANHGAGAWVTGGGGAGSISWTYTLTSTGAGNPPIADADVWVTTDVAGLNVIASGKTDQNGQVTFQLDAGTIYVWRQKSGWDFTNPDEEVVS